MEKRLNSMIAMLLVILLLFVYLLPYYVPFSSAQPVNNGSSIINGSISGIPVGVSVTLFIFDSHNNLVTPPIQGITSSFTTFPFPINSDDGEVIGFRINGKDTGTTIIFHPGTTMTVQLQYTAPGTGTVTIVPVTPMPAASDTPVTATPIPANVTATQNATPLPTPVLTNTATPSPISSPPAASASPIPGSVDLIIFAVVTGMIAIVALITGLRRL